ncbi:MAG: Ig-like domain repeat protein, partial [Bryobacteraceae bacterium]
DCAIGSFGYQAGPGYDQATGWGSVDANNLATEWSLAAVGATSLALSADPASVAWSSPTQLTATVAAAGGGTPTGTVSFLWGATVLGEVSLAGSAGAATAAVTLQTAQIGVGNQVLTAVYGGDASFRGSTAVLTLNVIPPSNGSAVLASITPNPAFQTPTSSGALEWRLTVQLTEVAGTGTTLTRLTIDGTDYTSRIASFFGSAAIAPNGTLTATLSRASAAFPSTTRFEFAGVDASGRQWTQQVSAALNGPLLRAAMALSSAPQRVLGNPNADSSCQWSQQLTLQEQNGFPIQLKTFLAGSNDYSSQMQQYFGTTMLAPFGTLQATFCSSGITSDRTTMYAIGGVDDRGMVVTALATATLAAGTASGTTVAVAPATVTMTADASKNATASVAVTLTGGASQWTVSVFPSNRATAWLSVSPGSAAASSQLTLQASGTGLASGVYRATLIVQAPNGLPQVVEVPVTFIVGASGGATIAGVANGASFRT